MMLKVGESLRVVATDHIIIHRDACGGYVGARRDTGPMHLLVDSTGLKLYGAGEWLVEKHGTKRRRSWRKMHLGVDAETGRIVAATLTDRDEADASQVGPLLDQVADPLASVTADGAYDQESVYADVAERHPGADVVSLTRDMSGFLRNSYCS